MVTIESDKFSSNKTKSSSNPSGLTLPPPFTGDLVNAVAEVVVVNVVVFVVVFVLVVISLDVKLV